MLLEKFKYYAEKEIEIISQVPILLAVSGGVDSVVLTHLLSKLDIAFGIAHCNFGLRNEASDGDEVFVEELAEKYRVSFHVKKFATATYAKERAISIQMAAREVRYKWLHQLMERYDYASLATAHHQNDHVETVLLNFSRGAGIRGLRGLQPKKGALIRPLLMATKEEIIEYAREEELIWREDASNQEDKYKRNFVRHQLVPAFEQLNPSFLNTVSTFTDSLAEVEDLLAAKEEYVITQAVKETEEEIRISIKVLEAERVGVVVLYRLLERLSFSYADTQQIVASYQAQSGKTFYSATHILIKDRTDFVIREHVDREKETILLTSFEECKGAPHFLIEEITYQGERPQATECYIAVEKLVFPIEIRPWQEGDAFEPFGMKGKKKKVSDLLVDLKVSVHEKAYVNVWIMDGEIVWVPGYRTSEYLRVARGKQCYKIVWNG